MRALTGLKLKELEGVGGVGARLDYPSPWKVSEKMSGGEYLPGIRASALPQFSDVAQASIRRFAERIIAWRHIGTMP